jgi:hypothetical protein
MTLLNEKQMSLLIALKIAGIKTEVATDVLEALQTQDQVREIEEFVNENKPLTEKMLLDKVSELTKKEN